MTAVGETLNVMNKVALSDATRTDSATTIWDIEGAHYEHIK